MFTAFLLSLFENIIFYCRPQNVRLSAEWKTENQTLQNKRFIHVQSKCNHNLQSVIINIYVNTVDLRYFIIVTVIRCEQFNVRFRVSYMMDSHLWREPNTGGGNKAINRSKKDVFAIGCCGGLYFITMHAATRRHGQWHMLSLSTCTTTAKTQYSISTTAIVLIVLLHTCRGMCEYIAI